VGAAGANDRAGAARWAAVQDRNAGGDERYSLFCCARSISSHSHISVIRYRPVKPRAKLGARLVMSPRSASAVDQIACGRRKGQRPIADEVNRLGRFDAEIHMRTSVSALAELMVRIHSPPADSPSLSGFRLGSWKSPGLAPLWRRDRAVRSAETRKV
jgi:hypothetical protein